MKKMILIMLFLLNLSVMAEMKKDTEVIWIDVRTTEEFKQGHIKDALHIPFEKIGKEILKVTTDKTAKIMVYCKVGGRAGIAKKTLDSMGYKNVTNAGGYKQILKEIKK